MNNRLALYIKNIFWDWAVLLVVINSVNVDICWPYLQGHRNISTSDRGTCQLRRDSTHPWDVFMT